MWKMKKYSQCHVIFADIRKIDLPLKKNYYWCLLNKIWFKSAKFHRHSACSPRPNCRNSQSNSFWEKKYYHFNLLVNKDDLATFSSPTPSGKANG